MEDLNTFLEEKKWKHYLQKYKFGIIIIGSIFFIFFITITILFVKSSQKEEKKKQPQSEISFIKEAKKKEKNEKNIETWKVDIKGEVISPGVYELEKNSRIMDVIYKAGGLKEQADTNYINLSKKIKDEMVIIIYSKQEIEDYKKEKNTPKYIYIEPDCECPDEMNEACIQEKETKEQTTTSKEKKDSIISINKATLEELQTLSGIGKSKAENIIKYREENGDFKNIEDIKNVSGIGDSAFEKIKDKIKL